QRRAAREDRQASGLVLCSLCALCSSSRVLTPGRIIPLGAGHEGGTVRAAALGIALDAVVLTVQQWLVRVGRTERHLGMVSSMEAVWLVRDEVWWRRPSRSRGANGGRRRGDPGDVGSWIIVARHLPCHRWLPAFAL